MGKEASSSWQSQGNATDAVSVLDLVLKEIRDLRTASSSVDAVAVIRSEILELREEMRVCLSEVCEALRGAQRAQPAGTGPSKGASIALSLKIPSEGLADIVPDPAAGTHRTSKPRTSSRKRSATPASPSGARREGSPSPRNQHCLADAPSQGSQAPAPSPSRAAVRHFGVHDFQKALQKQLLGTTTRAEACLDLAALRRSEESLQSLRRSRSSEQSEHTPVAKRRVSQELFSNMRAPAAAANVALDEASTPKEDAQSSPVAAISLPAQDLLVCEDLGEQEPASVEAPAPPVAVEHGGAEQGRPQAGPARVAWDDNVEAIEVSRNLEAPTPNALMPVRRAGSLVAVPFGRGSLDKIRRRIEEVIVRNHAAFSGTLVEDTSVLLSASDSQLRCYDRLLQAVAIVLEPAILAALRVGGVLPMSPRHVWPSILFQWAVLVLHTGIFGFLIFMTKVNLSEANSMPFYAGDLVLAGGSVCGLLAVGAGTGSGQFRYSLAKLEELNDMRDFSCTVGVANTWDALLTLIAWLTFVSERLSSANFLANGGLAGLSWTEALRHGLVLCSSFQVIVLVLAVLRVTRNMESLVDGFCTSFCEGMSYVSAVPDWNNVQASLRMASGAVEWCFAILQSILVLLALAMAVDLRELCGAEWALTCSGMLILGMSQMMLRAAAVTDSCVRISQLVNATALNEIAMDQERRYLVDYITASAAGFYVFNVRLGAGFAIKVLHYTGLMAFTLARLVLPATSQP